MASPVQLALRGTLVILGKQPDGDSVRFVADTPDLYQQLGNANRIHPSADGSVQLRFEGVDAPELHYGSAAQPLGERSRDGLLGHIGFTAITYEDESPTKVFHALPAEGIRAAILATMAEANGRPVAYVVVGDDGTLPVNGEWTMTDHELMDRTLNAWLLREGLAYYTVYTSTPVAHRDQLRELARAARDKPLEVWAGDLTAEFTLADQTSIGPDGQLILPKLFRRCTDYLKAVAQGFTGNLADWLVQVSTTPSRNENDMVLLGGTTEVPLSTLLRQHNQRIAFQADLLDITFVEK